MEYYARISKDGKHKQSLRDHLGNVAGLARRFAEASRPGDRNFARTAELAGLLHDLGKYREEFQRLLMGLCQRGEQTHHKQAGAAAADKNQRIDVSFAIAGHHGGLPDREALRQLILGPGGRDVADRVWPAATQEYPALNEPLPRWPYAADPFVLDVIVRLLFAGLVDADWQDTSAFHRRVAELPPEPEAQILDGTVYLDRVLAYIGERAVACGPTSVGAIRDEVLKASLAAARQTIGLFQMTVPTGGAKTLSSLAFALAHAKYHGLRRIIYVAPYLSVIEQNSREIHRALQVEKSAGVIFEHHSLVETQVNEEENEKSSECPSLAENWDAPVIITTNVQFFESLFASRAGACRKIHNIARSVIILDECQTLPPGLVTPTCDMLVRLSELASCTIVCCTATQPAWQRRPDLPEGLPGVRDVVPASLNLFKRLRRVQLTWPDHREQRWQWDEVAEEMLRSSAALCIVNTRPSARKLYRILRDKECDTVRHLSTSMCPAHRLQILDEIKQRLGAGAACQLVSTQLIEAGVDIDFPRVFREMAPLEAIVQAAGRCNREGRLPSIGGRPGGEVVVFRSADGATLPDQWYQAGIRVVEQDFLATGRVPDITRPEDIEEYFRRLYKTGELDTHDIQNLRRRGSLAEVGRLYRLIDQETTPVVVATWDPLRSKVEALIKTWRADPSRRNLRRLAPYQVNLRNYELDQAQGAIVQEPSGLRVWFGPYDPQLGLIASDDRDLPPV